MPNECIPEPPPVAVEPPQDDPIVGTYHIFYNQMPERQQLYRIYADGSITSNQAYFNEEKRKTLNQWVKTDRGYDLSLHQKGKPPIQLGWLHYQSIIGEPDIVRKSCCRRPPMPWVDAEGIKLSDDPDFETDFYVLGSNDRYKNWACFNIGRKEFPVLSMPRHAHYPALPNFAKSKSECRSLCRPAVDQFFARPGNEKYSHIDAKCPEDRQ